MTKEAQTDSPETESKKDDDKPGVGHNGVSGERLKAFFARIDRLEEEKKALAEDIKDVYAEAKATGFEPKIMRKIQSLKKSNIEKRREEAELVELYAAAIQMPLI